MRPFVQFTWDGSGFDLAALWAERVVLEDLEVALEDLELVDLVAGYGVLDEEEKGRRSQQLSVPGA